MASHSTGATMPGGDDVDRTIPMPPRADDPEPAALPPGEGYRVGELLGRGGEGEVHAAVQLAFGRSVAIKTLRSGSPEPRLVKRFRAEAAITALLEHPNIIPVHDLRMDALGRLQLVMKRVSGRTWRELIEDGRMPLDEHIPILLKVCDAVESAHGHGVLHRDLKPENVMVGAHGEVLVMDWGCAAHRGPQAPHPDIPVLADLDGVSGTPSYISPEQARAEHTACGPWSDVYLLGASLYRLLTGTAPRIGGDVRGLVANAAAAEAIPEPALRAGRRVSNELAAIAMATLEPDPAKRTRSVAEFAGSLRRYLEHREVLELVAEARRQHDIARAGGAGADDAFRRAIGAAEQATQLWPELMSARRLLVVVNLDAARHAYGAGALRQAIRQAQTAGAAAQRLDDGESANAAARIAANASAREAQLLQRERKHTQVRKLALAAGGVAVLSLLVGLLFAWRESARTAAALASARDNLAQAERERAARVAGERLAAPALLAQAHEEALQHRYAEGLALADTAIGFAPDQPRPLLVRAELLIALDRRAEAIAALDSVLALGDDPDAAELRRLCADPPIDADARIADLLVRMGAGAAAGALHLAADKRADLAMAQLRRHWPNLPGGCTRSPPHGTLSLRLTAGDLRVESLEPLRGMPISSLELTGQDRLRDIAPLASLPLVSLSARNTGVRDFSPLRGLPLRRLWLGWSEGGIDLDIIRGAPLESLEASGTGIADLAMLAGMPLRELRLYGCTTLADISALRGKPLTVLTLDAVHSGSATLTDLAPLQGNGQLAELSLSWQRGITDLSPLRGCQLRRVTLNGTNVSDLAPIVTPSLRNLAIGDTAVGDLSGLLGLSLDTLDVAPQRIRKGLDEVLRMPTLRLVCGYRPSDFTAWIALSQALADADPGYQWNCRATFTGGRITELRFPAPIRSLEPLAGLTDLRVLSLPYGRYADLRPLAGLHLTDLAVAPARDALGLDALRRMGSLQRIGSTEQRLVPAADWWREWDAGR